jgi:acylphosphatase
VAAHRRFRLEGRVQGVGFRWWARREAAALGLRGTIRNLPDGAVEADVYGPAADVAELERRLRAGPPGAVVERLLELEPAAGRPPADFRITG